MTPKPSEKIAKVNRKLEIVMGAYIQRETVVIGDIGMTMRRQSDCPL